ncbi:hypothetical protein ABES03_01580 [Neobacillus rhizosphaerae]|uniref:hypothetical protein n=1 Tax=Neobacillus rhizosphaerae TaxID=2880965 RepID=UPI003D2CBF3C
MGLYSYVREEKKLKFLKTITIFILSLLLLSACSDNASLKDESKSAIKTAKATFTEKEKKPSKKSGKIHFFLPAGYVIKSKSANNIILRSGSDTYILFYNPQESTTSDVVYKATVDQYKELYSNEKFTSSENKLGFITIKHLKDDGLNELTIGVGGAKITTQSETSDLVENTKTMMQIVNSVKFTK